MPFLIIFIVVMVLLNLFSSQIIATLKGAIGEAVVSKMLKKLPEDEYIVIDNIMLSTEKGTTQIDHVVLSIYGIFVLEVKNYKGWIIGTDRTRQWTQNIYGKKYKFLNPIWQNYGHVKTLENLLDIPQTDFIPMVIFSVNADLKVKTDNLVLYTANFRKKILEFKTIKFTRSDIDLFKTKIDHANIDSKEKRKEHVKQIKQNVQKDKERVKSGNCPKCRGNLVERNGKYGSFTGCSNFPSCRYTVR